MLSCSKEYYTMLCDPCIVPLSFILLWGVSMDTPGAVRLLFFRLFFWPRLECPFLKPNINNGYTNESVYFIINVCFFRDFWSHVLSSQSAKLKFLSQPIAELHVQIIPTKEREKNYVNTVLKFITSRFRKQAILNVFIPLFYRHWKT